jgi:hypothetical protein
MAEVFSTYTDSAKENRPLPTGVENGRRKFTESAEDYLFGQFNLGGRDFFLAIHVLDCAGHGDLLGTFADVLVKIIADIVFLDVVGDRLAVFFDLKRILAGVGFVKGALGAASFARDGLDIIGESGCGERHEQQRGYGEKEGGSDFFHNFGLVYCTAI